MSTVSDGSYPVGSLILVHGRECVMLPGDDFDIRTPRRNRPLPQGDANPLT